MLRAFLQTLAGLLAGTAVLCTATSALAGACDGFGAGNMLPALVNPFPGLSDAMKAQAPDLPQPEASPYAPRSRARRTGWEGAGRSGMLRDAERAGTTALYGLARTLEGGQ